MKKYAFIFPGQGAQYIGMGRSFYDQFSIAKETFQEADELLGFHLSKLIFDGEKEELNLTVNSQIAIYVTSVAILRALEEQVSGIKPSVCAGLSLGEYTALTASNRLAFKDGVNLVRKRGEFMHEASVNHPGTMSVVLALAPETVSQVIQDVSVQDKVWVANLNCPGQVVISGEKDGIAALAEPLKAAGAKRVLPLAVSGAFHSGLMKDAQEKLTPYIQDVALQDSNIELVMNVPGDFVSDLNEVRMNMQRQVTEPVLWEKGICVMKDVDAFIEIGCGKTLTGMNKKIGVDAPTYCVDKLEDLEAFTSKL